MHKKLNTLTFAFATIALSGCSTLQPEMPEVDAQIGTDQSIPMSQENEYELGDASELEWRNVFNDPKLMQLIELALENNRDLRTATLDVERARAQYRIQRAERIPSVNGSGAMNRLGGDGQPDVEQYQAQVGVTQFELDLFGRMKSLSDVALRNYLATDEARKSVQLSLIAEVANAYLTLSIDSELLRLAEATSANYEESYQIFEKRFELGAVSSLELSQARTLLASSKAEIATYQGLVQLDKTALAVLVGNRVSEELYPDYLDLDVSGLARLPARLPSEALLRRPDIQQSEYLLQAANANLGAARAAFFPSISLTGTVGSLSGDLSDLFSGGTGTWSFIPQVTMPIFQGGRLKANRDVAAVDRQIALARYEKAIQIGFKEVADALYQSVTLEDRREALEAFAESAAETEALSRSRYEAGQDSYLNLLDAQRTLYGARQALVQAQLQEQVNRINLYKVLGGGWNAES
ncbi:efflux transporter outer membrane subunit [Pelagicoccus sp. SDUM812003]|uniref:efflux transporter outer membrane subunit n=1 Tax=Pelagicoccus sp. SDUM812003 TaxID=3041267 RepID=UPI00280DA438|nr:efflux transporter outer membrane subunit [Pelagicoccus sp. SDUM812003]MDQ8203392.1 efflux transporter outer membrane subunit [Pelagicoccus sp. SDUM812003]